MQSKFQLWLAALMGVLAVSFPALGVTASFSASAATSVVAQAKKEQASGDKDEEQKKKKVTVVNGANGEKFYTGFILDQKKNKYGKTYVQLDGCDNLPAEFDLRDLGVVPKIKNQGQCGSCWSFSKTASLESAVGQGAPDLSEQELVSNDKNNYGCQGGMLNQTEYQVAHGQGLESDWPYSGRDEPQRQIAVAKKASKFVYIGGSVGSGPSEQELKCAIYKSHTIPWIVVSAGDNWSSAPTASKGLFTACNNNQPNHAVGVVGWDTINGRTYFKMRNSWGSGWGNDAGRPGMERGYALMTLGCSMLGYEAAYAIAEGVQPPPAPPGPVPPGPVPPAPDPVPPIPPDPGPGPVPPPCTPPTPKLPMYAMIRAYDTMMFAVVPEADTTYAWATTDGKLLGSGSTFKVSGLKRDTVLRVSAKNSCGTAESQMKIRVTGNRAK